MREIDMTNLPKMHKPCRHHKYRRAVKCLKCEKESKKEEFIVGVICLIAVGVVVFLIAHLSNVSQI